MGCLRRLEEDSRNQTMQYVRSDTGMERRENSAVIKEQCDFESGVLCLECQRDAKAGEA